ncbi:hypothetical protein [Streptomyces sp. NK08204]|uniref:hypothetical protein n=1 Tax=Streptomyces sp. NK08204 TaxID=2873260 RepID=UPI001CEC1FB7|nr:hypothetical protein [Streptomyces sp. NK08204]
MPAGQLGGRGLPLLLDPRGPGRLDVPASGKSNLRVYVLDLDGANAAPGKIGTDGPYLK